MRFNLCLAVFSFIVVIIFVRLSFCLLGKACVLACVCALSLGCRCGADVHAGNSVLMLGRKYASLGAYTLGACVIGGAVALALWRGQVFASVESGSLSIITSALDSFLDLVCGLILFLTARSMRRDNKYRCLPARPHARQPTVLYHAALYARVLCHASGSHGPVVRQVRTKGFATDNGVCVVAVGSQKYQPPWSLPRA